MPQNILYHYTDATSLLNIINSNQFWVSKSNFMNDPEEIDYGLKQYENEINKYDDKDKPYFKPLLDWIKGVQNVHDYFIFSLSENYNSLTLWDRYSNSKGYAIGLDIDELALQLQNQDKISFMGLYKVNYHKEDQGAYIKKLVSDYLIAEKNNPNPPPIGTEATVNLLSQAFGSIFSFKQSAYKDEEEIRVMFSLPNIKNLVSEEIWKKNINFRSTNNYIVPFIKLNVDFKKVLKSIIIGPKNNDERSKIGLEEFLNMKQFHIDISKSPTLYR